MSGIISPKFLRAVPPLQAYSHFTPDHTRLISPHSVSVKEASLITAGRDPFWTGPSFNWHRAGQTQTEVYLKRCMSKAWVNTYPKGVGVSVSARHLLGVCGTEVTQVTLMTRPQNVCFILILVFVTVMLDTCFEIT